MLPLQQQPWRSRNSFGETRRPHHSPRPRRVECRLSAAARGQLTDPDYAHLEAAAKLAGSPEGVTQPHPNAACRLVGPDGRTVISEAYQRAQGTTSAEVLAVAAAGPAARGATAYLNLEPGDCHGEAAAVEALVRAGVGRVVVGLRHPLRHLRSRGIGLLRGAGLRVDVLADELALGRNGTPAQLAAGLTQCSTASGSDSDGPFAPGAGGPPAAYTAMGACLAANEALLHRAALRRPLGVLKYAMTLDGKIATNLGHSAWVSSSQSRALVFETRARSDAVIVGGNTVRRDNPRLTTRREGGHTPARIVMSRTLDLPEDANLWDVTLAPTIVLTQRGARTRFQAALRAQGVEVVEFDFLTPESVADYCQERGFLQCFWECGGTLAAPAIASGVVHKVMAFVAPKIIGGLRAPTPVGELGFVEMTQAVELVDTEWSQVGPDLMITGYMPSSGGLWALEAALEGADDDTAAAAAAEPTVHLPGGGAGSSAGGVSGAADGKSAGGVKDGKDGGKSGGGVSAKRRRNIAAAAGRSVSFYKAWDQWGALSNFSPHPIAMPVDPEAVVPTATAAAAAGEERQASGGAASTSGRTGGVRTWPSVEHYYQAHKFSGGHHPEAAAVMEAIAAAPSPEEAARIGRRTERTRPELLRKDWGSAKLAFMEAALRTKFRTHAGPRAMLLATAGVTGASADHLGAAASAAAPSHSASASSSSTGATATAVKPAKAAVAKKAVATEAMCLELVEASPHDYFWGAGYERTGQNKLGRLLMQVRDELLSEYDTAVSCAAEGLWTTPEQLAGVAAASAAAPASRG
ncbi:hypothetical protein HYH02_001475 [Chlamydomonas schloesseri]|uniref:5-amino-6-(5-phosphoribosylamino)uracil reductase n=1 Tax=Chlamydomonas schloesseri TaxID=2026947 RepID=A0A835WXL4_9CHLO|nr:hypothetical protein HYH02_001475 [Chlamydomonas schloesseri]|eukprot:KAG2454456.1 hypothetical protein HYH02_001475 [Chlamydomonas schloesseri]